MRVMLICHHTEAEVMPAIDIAHNCLCRAPCFKHAPVLPRAGRRAKITPPCLRCRAISDFLADTLFSMFLSFLRHTLCCFRYTLLS